mmetsp:Transcript_5309/g.14262  ORF Transcript_5309/g.14262 Transcript_5309/m.14262 type:complete len:204 (+) Transcript_5309:953-1564(+)
MSRQALLQTCKLRINRCKFVRSRPPRQALHDHQMLQVAGTAADLPVPGRSLQSCQVQVNKILVHMLHRAGQFHVHAPYTVHSPCQRAGMYARFYTTGRPYYVRNHALLSGPGRWLCCTRGTAAHSCQIKSLQQTRQPHIVCCKPVRSKSLQQFLSGPNHRTKSVVPRSTQVFWLVPFLFFTAAVSRLLVMLHPRLLRLLCMSS